MLITFTTDNVKYDIDLAGLEEKDFKSFELISSDTVRVFSKTGFKVDIVFKNKN